MWIHSGKSQWSQDLFLKKTPLMLLLRLITLVNKPLMQNWLKNNRRDGN